MLPELEKASCLEGAVAIWSMWAGYLDRPVGRRIVADLERLGIALSVEHASGHASPADLERFAHQLGAARVVPIHTEAPDLFGSHFRNVVRYGDGEWWMCDAARSPRVRIAERRPGRGIRRPARGDFGA